MSTNRNVLTSPVGEILFMAAEKAVVDKKTGKAAYSISLAINPKDDTNKWLEEVADINNTKVVTAKTYRGESDRIKAVLATGKVKVEAKSNFKPEIFDKDGNLLEEAPLFLSGSTGTAQMYVQPYQGEKGGTINLIGIKIHTIDTPESTTTGVDRETRLAQLRALA